MSAQGYYQGGQQHYAGGPQYPQPAYGGYNQGPPPQQGYYAQGPPVSCIDAQKDVYWKDTEHYPSDGLPTAASSAAGTKAR
ncbi:MAG: hypothetical protein M1818_000749 [Claussenomyces sp. TS43310]|nr:MAG: hypothetical protein M1818_000749 [Claussenomyces sp. TS43310]